jgi:hypothetical protein
VNSSGRSRQVLTVAGKSLKLHHFRNITNFTWKTTTKELWWTLPLHRVSDGIVCLHGCAG